MPLIPSATSTSASGGLTITASPYAINDCVGQLFTLPAVAFSAGSLVNIESVQLVDKVQVTQLMDVIFFRQAIAMPADNAPFSISDTDALMASPVFQIAMQDIGGNRVGGTTPFWTMDLIGTSLYAALITRATITQFTAVNDLQLTVRVRQY